MRTLISIILAFTLYSCTYSINLVHTDGEADDVIKEESSNAPEISPTLEIPPAAI